VDAGRLVSCVQIFPRPLAIGGQSVPTGGIGSVFTLPDYRRRGIAEALLARAAGAMSASGFELSLLFAARIPWYTRLGWRSWSVTRTLLERRAPARPATAADILGFEADRDLAAVQAIHRHYSGALDGTVVRDGSLWEASLANAGNPDEDFRVARARGELLAYARSTVLLGFSILTEFGRAAAGAAALAELLDAMVGEHTAAGNLHRDPELERALAGRGFGLHRGEDPTGMLRCIDPAALAKRLGVAPPEAGDSGVWLEAVLPPERFAFWSADRF
jgi:hypothetical protein